MLPPILPKPLAACLRFYTKCMPIFDQEARKLCHWGVLLPKSMIICRGKDPHNFEWVLWLFNDVRHNHCCVASASPICLGRFKGIISSSSPSRVLRGKTNIEPENGPLEKEIPFGNRHFQVPCYFLVVYCNQHYHDPQHYFRWCRRPQTYMSRGIRMRNMQPSKSILALTRSPCV